MSAETMNIKPSLLQRLALEPTVHFFAIAAGLFALYAIVQGDDENLLIVEQADIDARIFMQELSRGEELSEEQKELVTAFYIEEQILVREALAMELENDDRIHDILAQKMRHVLSGNIIQPSDEELEVFYNANLNRYETDASLNIDELVFNSREDLDDSLLTALSEGAQADELLLLAEGTVAPLPNVNSVDLGNIFDQEFAERVLASDLLQWQGPFISNRGQHWLRVTERIAAGIPPLAEITELVRLDWIAVEEEIRLQSEIDKLWDEYTIVITASTSEH